MTENGILEPVGREVNDAWFIEQYLSSHRTSYSEEKIGAMVCDGVA